MSLMCNLQADKTLILAFFFKKHRDRICQFSSIQSIHQNGNGKTTENTSGKSHLCASWSNFGYTGCIITGEV